MSDLIEALTIFLKYANPKWPTCCSHDELWIMEVEPENVIENDVKRLDELGFFIDESEGCFKSFRFGSA